MLAHAEKKKKEKILEFDAEEQQVSVSFSDLQMVLTRFQSVSVITEFRMQDST